MHVFRSQFKAMSLARRNAANKRTSAQATYSNALFSRLGTVQRNAHDHSINSDDQQNRSMVTKTLIKYVVCATGAAYVYDKTANHFFLATTSFHDHKQGFTSNARLQEAEKVADANYHAYHHNLSKGCAPKTDVPLLPKLCGENLFVTMVDFRAATKVHMKHLIDTKEAHDSIAMNIACIKGDRIKPELLEKYEVVQAPVDFDMTQSAAYDSNNKYSLSGVPNQETGSFGYASRSISHPFIEKGAHHHAQALNSAQAITPKASIDALQSLLQTDERLNSDAQFKAGQALLIFRPLYCSPENWGDAHKVLMDFLEAKGLVSSKENQRLGETRPLSQSDLKKGIARRNTSLAGPLFNELNLFIHQSIYREAEEIITDLQSIKLKEMKYIPITHCKMNDACFSFEDSSGLADSFTAYNVALYINHARLLSGEKLLSKNDIVVIIGCLNAIYDNAGSERHSLKETARGCFVGAGYTVDDADAFYKDVCKTAALEFYTGKALNRRFAVKQTHQQ